MELVLWRHADAEDGVIDMKRQLTDKGRKQAAKVARWLHQRMEGRWLILSSPAVRATQTADALDLEYEVRPALGLAATPDGVIREAGWPSSERNVMIVGHQPTLGRVAAQLLTGHPGDLALKKGALWWFSCKGERAAVARETLLRAVIAPDFAD
jgi:phosphohistidine phosphatase